MEGNMDGVMKLLSVAPEDGYCVDPAKYKEFGRCDPAVAMECMMSIDRELLSPISTHDRLCLYVVIRVMVKLLNRSIGMLFFWLYISNNLYALVIKVILKLLIHSVVTVIIILLTYKNNKVWH